MENYIVSKMELTAVTTQKNKIICIVGPTASGKTALAVSLAKKLGGEIISCDAMQIYEHLSIGTAKPTDAEMDEIPHHLIGFADPRKPFSCVDYVPLAQAAIADIISHGNIPIFCGGTGLYLDSTVRNIIFSDQPKGDTAISDALRAEYEKAGIDGIYQRLQAIDPTAAASIHKNNTKRVIRALEIYLATGKTKTEWDLQSQCGTSPYDAVYLGLDFKDRSILHARIDQRVLRMMESGLLEEVRALYSGGYLPDGSTAAQAIGYKEFLAYLQGDITLDAAVARVQAASRQYAKRQLTWFRRNPAIHWLYVDTYPETNRLQALCGDAVSAVKAAYGAG